MCPVVLLEVAENPEVLLEPLVGASDWPSVCGWYAVLIFCSTWKSLQSSCEKVEVKQGSWSDMIHDGSP